MSERDTYLTLGMSLTVCGATLTVYLIGGLPMVLVAALGVNAWLDRLERQRAVIAIKRDDDRLPPR